LGESGYARNRSCICGLLMAAGIAMLGMGDVALGAGDSLIVIPQKQEATPQRLEPIQTPTNAMSKGATEEGQAGFGKKYSDQMILDRSATTQTGNQIGNSANGADGGEKAKGLASQLFGIGAGLIASGIALNASSKPCYCAGMPLIAAGIFFNKGGQGSNNAGNAMIDMSGISNIKRDDLADINNINLVKTNLPINQNKTNPGDTQNNKSLIDTNNAASRNANAPGLRVDGRFDAENANRITIDETALSKGKAGEAFAAIEAAYGIDRKELAQALVEGQDVIDFLAKKGALNGKSAEEYRDMLAAESVDASKLREQFENGEMDEYKDLVNFEGEGGNGLADANKGKADGIKAGSASLKREKTYAELMAEIFGKNSTIAGVKLEGAAELSPSAAEKDPQLRALASNSSYRLSRDYLAGGDFREKNLFERVNRIYRTNSSRLVPEDYFIRLQSERDRQKIR
jgi:hypothetical protein